MKKAIITRDGVEKIIGKMELRAELLTHMYEDDMEIIIEEITKGQKEFYFSSGLEVKII